MGYTHYFNFVKPKGVKAAKLEATYLKALKECARVAKRWNAECESSGESYARLSGYTAHTRIGQYGGLQLNGKADEACESLELREHFRQNIDAETAPSGYVKTNRKPYDTVIIACLAILKHRLGDAFSVSSDGYQDDWNAGVDLARRVTRLKIANPMQGKVNLRLVS